MFELETLSSAVTIAAAIAAALVTFGLLKLLTKPKRVRGSRRRINRVSHRCSMCQRPTPEDVLQEWKIRSVTQQICERCHPFYKMRFSGADAQQTMAAPARSTLIAARLPVHQEPRTLHEDTAAISP